MQVPTGWKRIDVIVSGAFVLASLVAVGFLIFHPEDKLAQRLVIGAWVGWALIPPAYFLIDWSLFEGGNKSDDEDFARMKYSHELASKFWLAGVGLLSAVLLTVLKIKL